MEEAEATARAKGPVARVVVNRNLQRRISNAVLGMFKRRLPPDQRESNLQGRRLIISEASNSSPNTAKSMSTKATTFTGNKGSSAAPSSTFHSLNHSASNPSFLLAGKAAATSIDETALMTKSASSEPTIVPLQHSLGPEITNEDKPSPESVDSGEHCKPPAYVHGALDTTKVSLSAASSLPSSTFESPQLSGMAGDTPEKKSVLGKRDSLVTSGLLTLELLEMKSFDAVGEDNLFPVASAPVTSSLTITYNQLPSRPQSTQPPPQSQTDTVNNIPSASQGADIPSSDAYSRLLLPPPKRSDSISLPTVLPATRKASRSCDSPDSKPVSASDRQLPKPEIIEEESSDKGTLLEAAKTVELSKESDNNENDSVVEDIPPTGSSFRLSKEGVSEDSAQLRGTSTVRDNVKNSVALDVQKLDTIEDPATNSVLDAQKLELSNIQESAEEFDSGYHRNIELGKELWVPAYAHPEVNPADFKSWLSSNWVEESIIEQSSEHFRKRSSLRRNKSFADRYVVVSFTHFIDENSCYQVNASDPDLLETLVSPTQGEEKSPQTLTLSNDTPLAQKEAKSLLLKKPGAVAGRKDAGVLQRSVSGAQVRRSRVISKKRGSPARGSTIIDGSHAARPNPLPLIQEAADPASRKIDSVLPSSPEVSNIPGAIVESVQNDQHEGERRRSYSEVVVGHSSSPPKNSSLKPLDTRKNELIREPPIIVSPLDSGDSFENIMKERLGENNEEKPDIIAAAISSVSDLDFSLLDEMETDGLDYGVIVANNGIEEDSVGAATPKRVESKMEGRHQSDSSENVGKKAKKSGLLNYLHRLVGGGSTNATHPIGSTKPEELHESKEKTSEDSDSDFQYPEVPAEFLQNGNSRFPEDVEKQIYQSSHRKVADRRRSLHQQVIISNLMLYIISVHAEVTLNRNGRRAKRGRREPGGGKRRRRSSVNGGDPAAQHGPQSSRASVSPGRARKTRMTRTPPPVLVAQESDATDVKNSDQKEETSAEIARLLSGDDDDEDDDVPLGYLIKFNK
ncbi:MAG: hypothetical protein SGCHY_002621 [Lobulomycetales sp.]